LDTTGHHIVSLQPPGEGMETPELHSQDLFDERGEISVDVACRRCSYDLRGLREDGRCPECGTPIGRSTHGDLLQYSEPAWVAKLARGINLILWGIGITIIGAVAGVALSVATGNQAIIFVVVFAASLIGLWGTWLLTEPDPSRIGEDTYGTARKIVRIALVVGVLTQAVVILGESLQLPPVLMVIVGLVMVAGGLFGIVAEFARLYYLSKMAERIPNEQLERRASFLKWAMSITLLFTSVPPAVIGVLAAAPPMTPAGGGGAVVALGCVSGAAGLVNLVFLLVYLRMLYRFRGAFREQAELARAIWAQPAQPSTPPE
jgi:hypothetical protein